MPEATPQSPRKEVPRSGDRRRRPTPLISPYTFFGRGRRRGFRRREDGIESPYVDRYGINSVVLVLTALLLCIGDAFFTIQLVENGAREVNPLMWFLLSKGALPFLLVKYIATGGSLLFLLVHKDRSLWGGRAQGRHVLAAVPLTYAMIILWEITLNSSLS